MELTSIGFDILRGMGEGSGAGVDKQGFNGARRISWLTASGIFHCRIEIDHLLRFEAQRPKQS